MLQIIGEHPTQQQEVELKICSLYLEVQEHLVWELVDTSAERGP
jgi:hypothetical protein